MEVIEMLFWSLNPTSQSAILFQWPWPLTPTNNNLPKAAIPADLDFSLYYLQNDLQQILALTAMIIHQ